MIDNFIPHSIMDVITYHAEIKVKPCQLKGPLMKLFSGECRRSLLMISLVPSGKKPLSEPM